MSTPLLFYQRIFCVGVLAAHLTICVLIVMNRPTVAYVRPGLWWRLVLVYIESGTGYITQSKTVIFHTFFCIPPWALAIWHDGAGYA